MVYRDIYCCKARYSSDLTKEFIRPGQRRPAGAVAEKRRDASAAAESNVPGKNPALAETERHATGEVLTEAVRKNASITTNTHYNSRAQERIYELLSNPTVSWELPQPPQRGKGHCSLPINFINLGYFDALVEIVEANIRLHDKAFRFKKDFPQSSQFPYDSIPPLPKNTCSFLASSALLF